MNMLVLQNNKWMWKKELRPCYTLTQGIYSSPLFSFLLPSTTETPTLTRCLFWPHQPLPLSISFFLSLSLSLLHLNSHLPFLLVHISHHHDLASRIPLSQFAFSPNLPPPPFTLPFSLPEDSLFVLLSLCFHLSLAIPLLPLSLFATTRHYYASFKLTPSSFGKFLTITLGDMGCKLCCFQFLFDCALVARKF